MIRQFIQRLFYCFYSHKIHARTPEQIDTPDITFRKSSKQKGGFTGTVGSNKRSVINSPRTSQKRIYDYTLFEIILERKLQELNDKI